MVLVAASAASRMEDLPGWRGCAIPSSSTSGEVLDAIMPTNKTPQPKSGLQQNTDNDVDWSALRSKRYDRELEENILRDVYLRCILPQQEPPKDQKSEVVLITGASGMGKSSLANSLQEVVEGGTERNSGASKGFFISGKFDKLESPENFYPIIQAFTEFARKATKRGKQFLSSIRKDLAHLSGTGTDHTIIDLIPALQTAFTGSNVQLAGASGKRKEEAQKRLVYGIRSFVKAICSAERPLLLFLDDLQWADPASLGLVAALVSGQRIEGFMLLGTCRDGEVRRDHRLAVTLRELETNGVGISTVMLNPLEVDTITDIIEDTLRLPPVCAADLADMVLQKTRGNPFFVMQVLRSLSDEKLFEDIRLQNVCTESTSGHQESVQQDESMSRLWDSIKRDIQDQLEARSTAVELLSDTISKLSPEVQNVLTIASCFGSEFDQLVIRTVVDTPKITEYLFEAQEKGLLEGVGEGIWHFTHDQVHQSAYAMISEEEKQTFHLQIGRKLWNSFDREQLDAYGFLVVNQLRIGASLIQNQDERDNMALLLLGVGQKAASSSSFVSAAQHLNLAISLLDQHRHWRDHYELSLELYSAAAELEYCNANFTRSDELVSKVLQNARSTGDAMRVRTATLTSLGTQGKLQAALKYGLSALRDLGEGFPKKPRVIFLIRELVRTKKMLQKISDDAILRLPPTVEDNKLIATRIMILIFSYAHKTPQPMFSPLIAMRLVQMSLRDGISSMSCVGFAKFGMLLCGPFGDVELGTRLAKLSLRLLEKYQANEWFSRVHVTVYGNCFLYSKPWGDQLPFILASHRLGLGSGDMEFGMLASALYTSISIFASQHLSDTISNAFSFLELAKIYQHIGIIDFVRFFLQLALNLAGKSATPLVLDGQVMVESVAWEEAVSSNNTKTMALFFLAKLTLLVYFQDHAQAEQQGLELSKSHSTKMFPPPYKCTWWLSEGVAALAMCQKCRTRKRMGVAKRNIQQLKALAKHSPDNIVNKIYLLEAELAALDGHTDKALGLFQMSIENAEKAGLCNEAGLAYERAAAYLMRNEKQSEAKLFTENAIASYAEWGAFGKVEQLQRSIAA